MTRRPKAQNTGGALPASKSQPRSWWSILGRTLGIILVVSISVAIFTLGEKIEHLQSWGYLGAFFVMLLSNATIILPAPGLTIVFALGSALNPALVGIAGGAGGSLGELTGYIAGFSGSAVVEHRAIYKRLETWMKRYGLLVIFILAIIPNPFFDIVGLIAGTLRLSWWRFLLVAWIGKTIQSILIALTGAASAAWVLEWLF